MITAGAVNCYSHLQMHSYSYNVHHHIKDCPLKTENTSTWLRHHYNTDIVYCKNSNTLTRTGQQQNTKCKWTADDYQRHIPQSLSSCCGPSLSNTYHWTWRNIAFLISHKVWPYSQTHSLTHSKQKWDTHTHTRTYSDEYRYLPVMSDILPVLSELLV